MQQVSVEKDYNQMQISHLASNQTVEIIEEQIESEETDSHVEDFDDIEIDQRRINLRDDEINRSQENKQIKTEMA